VPGPGFPCCHAHEGPFRRLLGPPHSCELLPGGVKGCLTVQMLSWQHFRGPPSHQPSPQELVANFNDPGLFLLSASPCLYTHALLIGRRRRSEINWAARNISFLRLFSTTVTQLQLNQALGGRFCLPTLFHLYAHLPASPRIPKNLQMV